MANGIKNLIEKHQEQADDGSFESLMCAFALEMLEWKGRRWKERLFFVGILLVPIVMLILDKVL